MNLQFLENTELRTDRLQQSIKMHQDSDPVDLFSENIILPILFFKNINYCVLNIANENGQMEQFQNDLFQSFDFIENYLHELTPQTFNSSINDFIPLLINLFINLDISINHDDNLFQFNNTIFSKALHCMYYLISLDTFIFRNFYSSDFLKRLAQIIMLDKSEINLELINLSQLIFSKLLKDEIFRIEMDYVHWMDITSYITNEDILCNIYYELSKNPEKINSDCVQNMIFLIMKIFPEKENFTEKIDLVIKNSKAITNCLEKVNNTLVLTNAQRDILQFMYKITDLIGIENFSEFHFQAQNKQIICFCEIMSCFIKKGIIIDKVSFINENHIIPTLNNFFQNIISFDESNADFFQANSLDKTIEKILDLFTILVDFNFSIDEFISIPACVNFALDSSFNVRKSSAVFVCKIIEREDLYKEFDFFAGDNNNFYRLILNLILFGAIEIMEPLLNCVSTLLYFDESGSFINFILNPDEFGEFDGLKEVLTNIKNDPKITSSKIIDPLEDILSELKKHSPKSQEEIYNGSIYENDNVYDEM